MLAGMSTGMNSASRVVSARIPRERYDRVVELASASGQTRGEYIRDAVLRELEREDEGPPDPGG
jgi:predicted DNA-binding protein